MGAARESFESREIMDVTGWTTAEYLDWKRGNEEIEQHVAAGRIQIPDADVAAPPAG